MSLILENPQTEVVRVTTFLRETFEKNHISQAVIAVSGGIDSAVALTLLTKALSPDQIIPLLLPFGLQDTDDSKLICDFNQIPEINIHQINIKPIVEACYATVELSDQDGSEEMERIRKGNIMARVRMVLIFDTAKQHRALVCGTENKSEHYLGYFTRFGDEASDIEPIQHLYKTQVFQLAQQLGIPETFMLKAPSAGLWPGQTDESHFGFTYEAADQVMEQLIDNKVKSDDIRINGVSEEEVKKVIQQIESQKFKHEVPYHL